MRFVIIASGSGKNIAKLSPVTVKERMGHTHINTTLSIYAHVLRDGRRSGQGRRQAAILRNFLGNYC
jgi:integrase